MCRGGGGKWAARKRARATEFKKRKEVEAPGKDGQETRADGTQDGKESQKNGDQAKTDEKNRKERGNRFRKDEEMRNLQSRLAK